MYSNKCLTIENNIDSLPKRSKIQKHHASILVAVPIYTYYISVEEASKYPYPPTYRFLC